MEGLGDIAMEDAQGNSLMGSAIRGRGMFFGSMLDSARCQSMLHYLGQAESGAHRLQSGTLSRVE